jgi:hypothetical protein
MNTQNGDDDDDDDSNNELSLSCRLLISFVSPFTFKFVLTVPHNFALCEHSY